MLAYAPTLSFTRTVDAPAAEVYRAFLAPAALRDWLCDAAEVDPRPGGRVYLWWTGGYYTAGLFRDLARDEGLAFTWQGPGELPGTLAVAFAARDAATDVTVTYTSADPTGQESASPMIARLWEGALENLQSVLERGVDLRIARRPMFGLSGGDDMNADRAAKLGVPVTTGIWIGGLVEGMGAHAAGLQRDDVVVRLGDDPITNFASFSAALRSYQAGDRVPLVFYRGAEEQTVLLELGHRPPVVVPESAAALAEQARATYVTMDAELAASLDGVTEEQADARPAPDEWGIKGVVAHLIAVERDTHTWIVMVSEGGDPAAPFHENVPQRTNGLLAAYPTLADLVTELYRAELTTVTMLASLPTDLNHRMYLLRPLADWITGLPDHSREHFAEIKALRERVAG